MREPETLYPLKIGLIGYNTKQTEYGLRVLAHENSEKVRYFTKDKIIFEDETEIHAIHNIDNVRGRKFDQLILCDDERWCIWKERRILIENVLSYIMGHTCVPDEHIVMNLEY